MLERWTRSVIRQRYAILAGWLLVIVVGVIAGSRLPPLLATSYAVPGTEAGRADAILARAFDERPEGTFTVVVPVRDPSDKAERHRLRRRLAAAASAVPTARVGEIRDGTGILYGTISTALEIQDAKGYTRALRERLARDGGPRAFVTGQPAIQHDVDPVIAQDLRRGEALGLVVALVVLLVVLGLSPAVLVPFVFAAGSVAATLAAVYLLAHQLTIATYVTSLVGLVGLGLAIDYSLLVVLRYREELAVGGPVHDAIVRTMTTAGRTTVVSGTAVAIGLGLLLLVPVPFVRSLGVGALLIPLASIAATLTLQPALLAVLGRRGSHAIPLSARLRHRASPTPNQEVEHGLWARIAQAVLRRPVAYLVGGTAVLAAAAAPLLTAGLTPGTLSGVPPLLESSRGYDLLRSGIGPGVVTPISVIVDTGRPGGARRRDVQRAIDRLGDRLFEDFDLVAIGSGTRSPYVDRTRRYARLIAAGREEYGAPATRAFVTRLRDSYVPDARFPADVLVATGGAPALGVDFLSRTYGAFPWIVLAALVLTYGALLRAFRSLLIPLKAVLLNVLTVAAVFGLLVVVFQWGAGTRLGLYRGEVEGWVPIFLFAVLFGLSMDYEVFVVSRMRESWDHVPSNERAISHGLQRTGGIVTAAAVIMAAAFTGFVAGRVAGLQQLGVGLVLAVLVDATLVRAVLVPSVMAVLGRLNWWLPESVARIARVAPSPLGMDDLRNDLTDPSAKRA